MSVLWSGQLKRKGMDDMILSEKIQEEVDRIVIITDLDEKWIETNTHYLEWKRDAERMERRLASINFVRETRLAVQSMSNAIQKLELWKTE